MNLLKWDFFAEELSRLADSFQLIFSIFCAQFKDANYLPTISFGTTEVEMVYSSGRVTSKLSYGIFMI